MPAWASAIARSSGRSTGPSGASPSWRSSMPVAWRCRSTFATRSTSVARSSTRPAPSSCSRRSQTEASARALGLPIILIETLPDLARRTEPLPAADIDGNALAEIVFTSGTTGEPKGAMLSHAQPRLVRHRHDPGADVRHEGPAAVRPAAVAPVRAGARAHRTADGRRERRLPGQPPAGRARAHVPRLPDLDPPDRARRACSS